MADLIDRQEAIRIASGYCHPANIAMELAKLPSAQQGWIEQIKWERDTAIAQLKELGYGLGEKMRTDADTISRQAAIDEITEYGSGDSVHMSVGELKRRIEQLPSAQPESPCNLCIYNPPSSMDGKPCCACPAERREDG